MSANNSSERKSSLLQRSLLFKFFSGMSGEIESPLNNQGASEHFHNDPRDHPEERQLHYIRTGAAKRFKEKFRRAKHPERLSLT